MEPIRILHITNNMNRGGQETFIMNLYRSIDRNKVQFDFLLSLDSKSDYEDEIMELGGRVYRTTLKTEGIGTFIQHTNKLLKECQTNYRIVHIHTSSIMSILGWLLTDIRKIPNKIIHSHNAFNAEDVVGIRRTVLRFAINRVTKLRFACSKEAAIWLFGQSPYKKNKIKIIKNGIDQETFAYRKSDRIAVLNELELEDKFIIGHIGRFNTQKNHRFIIDIMESIHRLNEDAILLLIGVGTLEEEIKQYVIDKNLENCIRFLGKRDDISRLLNSMDVLIMPSLYEGLPVVGVEAQSTGVRLVVSDTVSKDLDITGNILFVSLKESPMQWAKSILEFGQGYERKSEDDALNRHGYIISTTAKEMEHFYAKLV